MKTILKTMALVLAVSASAQAFVEYMQTEKGIQKTVPELIITLEDIQDLDLSDADKKAIIQDELQKFIKKNNINIKDNGDIYGVGEPGI